MKNIKRKNMFLTGLFALVLMFGAMFGFTGCGGGDENFNCSGKTFVYDSWVVTGEIDQSQQYDIEGMTMAYYSNTVFIFGTDGTYVWKNKTASDENATWKGTWEIVEQELVLTINTDGDQERLPIEGKKFYVTQPMSETLELHIYFKLG